MIMSLEATSCPCARAPFLISRCFRFFPLFGSGYVLANMPLAKDLLHPSPEEEKRRHKKKRLVQSPNSYFMDVKCPGCYKITTVFSHAQTVVLCVGCSTVLCQPTGGKARLTEGCSFRRKQH
ncbi:40S ribosomal protein S27.1 [Conger conger]|uniref:40S ribosomal protein S27.1 n=1 Tax=Conger conger TaxID=82655 RepID=UPI002A5A5A17|nr:40S ribosomal protein S27.1 [Conger conger]